MVDDATCYWDHLIVLLLAYVSVLLNITELQMFLLTFSITSNCSRVVFLCIPVEKQSA